MKRQLLIRLFAVPLAMYMFFSAACLANVAPPSQDYLDDISQEGTYTWPKEMFPLKVYIDKNQNVPGYRQNFPDILRGAFDEWVTASESRLGWVEVEKASDANIVVKWSRDAPERAQGTEAGRTKTYSRFNTETNEGLIYKATMALVTRLPDRTMSDVELKKTFLHEVGHAFGLAEHSPQRDDIMFARVSPTQDVHLSQRDRSTINRLYSDYPRRDPIASGSRPYLPGRS